MGLTDLKFKPVIKRSIVLILIVGLALALFAGCGGKAPSNGPDVCADGRARPSSCGRLKVEGGRLCAENGEAVMLRGVSLNDMMVSESFINDALFGELARDGGVNVCRFPVYTYGVGIIGYCTSGDRERYERDVEKGVELAKLHDMYALIDWHILSDGDPNTHADEAERFFAMMAEKFAGEKHVLYEICNEPNGVDWAAVKRYAERIIPVIREKDPDSVIIVGDPDWSKDLASVAADPLDFENIMYSLHFYSATHGEEVRGAAERAMEGGLPVFVTEFGITASSGDVPRDIESADKWIDLLEREGVSYCLWSLAKSREASSMVRFTVPKYSGFEESDWSESGAWLFETIAKVDGR